MALRFECPECEAMLNADVSMRGEYEVCPECKERIRIPLDAELMPDASRF